MCWTSDYAKSLKDAGFTRNHLRCYCLIGYPNDTMANAEIRLKNVLSIGMSPMAMLCRNEYGKSSYEWQLFQKKWARPAIVYRKKSL